MKHPHEGRMAETYRLSAPDKFGEVKLTWVGYTAGPDYADHPKGAKWDDTIKGWLLPHSAPRQAVKKP